MPEASHTHTNTYMGNSVHATRERERVEGEADGVHPAFV